jgi:very-short-patch-repair endonuclease
MMTSTFSIFSGILTDDQKRLLPHVGIKKILNPPKHYTSLENRYYNMLKEINVKFVPQFPLNGRYYDAYIPEKNLLLEFDGTFWHPKTEADAKYDHQKKAFKVDQLKNRYAKERGIKILRIREEAPITSTQLKELIEA